MDVLLKEEFEEDITSWYPFEICKLESNPEDETYDVESRSTSENFENKSTFFELPKHPNTSKALQKSTVIDNHDSSSIDSTLRRGTANKEPDSYEQFRQRTNVKICKKADITYFACRLCEKQFRNLLALYKHSQTHNNRPKFTCFKCGEKFPSQIILTNHLSSHTVKKWCLKTYDCDMCPSQFYGNKRLQLHRKEHLRELDKIFPCIICGQEFFSEGDLTQHLPAHDIKKYSCNKCSLRFRRKEHLRAHRKEHLQYASKVFSCVICDKEFLSQFRIRKHLSSHIVKSPPSVSRRQRSREEPPEQTSNLVLHQTERTSEELPPQTDRSSEESHQETERLSIELPEQTDRSSEEIHQQTERLSEELPEQTERSYEDLTHRAQQSSEEPEHLKERSSEEEHLLVHQAGAISEEHLLAPQTGGFHCVKCDRLFVENSTWIDHLITHSRQDRVEIRLSRVILTAREEKVVEELLPADDVKKEIFSCARCEGRFLERDGWIDHVRSHAVEDIVKVTLIRL